MATEEMAHRSAYGRDGDYWSKPSAEDVYDLVLEMVRKQGRRVEPEQHEIPNGAEFQRC